MASLLLCAPTNVNGIFAPYAIEAFGNRSSQYVEAQITSGFARARTQSIYVRRLRLPLQERLTGVEAIDSLQCGDACALIFVTCKV